MIIKQGNTYKPFKKGFKYFVIAEGVIFVSSYLAWASCNRSQATRKFFHDTPLLGFVLEFYYRTGETIGTSKVRAFDQMTWNSLKALEETKKKSSS